MEDEADSAISLDTDEENHIATQCLKELLDSGQISSETYSNLCFKFRKLHRAFAHSCSTEQLLLRRTRDLNKELKTQEIAIQNSATQQQEHRNSLIMLRQHVTNIQVELDVTNDQTNSTKINTEHKKKEIEKLERKLEMANEDQRIKLEPQKQQIQQEIDELTASIRSKKNTIEELVKYSTDIQERIQKADETLAEYEKKKRAENQKILEIGSNPVKLRQKANAAEAAHNQLLNDEKSLNTQLQQLENTIIQLDLQSHDLETEYINLGNDMDNMATALSDLKYKTSDLENKCDEQKQMKLVRENEKKRILKQIDEKNLEQSVILTKQESVEKDIFKKENEVQKLEEAISKLKTDKKTFESQLNIAEKEIDAEMENKKKFEREYERAMKDKEIAIQALVSTEHISQQMMDDIKCAIKEREGKQLIHDSLSLKEQDFLQQLSEASLIRDRKAREMAVMKKKTSDARLLAREKNLDFLDLSRKNELVLQNITDISKLYEQVKAERNRHVSVIQTSRQLIVELKEKVKILESEIEVLRNEFEIKDAQVRMQKNDLRQAFAQRDSTKTDLKKAEQQFQVLEAKIDFQANETERLNVVLQNIENSITTSQTRYSQQADDCADRRRMLIDKQDNICILYEQLNRHEEVMRRGEIELRKREEEIKVLELALKDFKRQIDLMQRKVPQVNAYNREIEELRAQIKKEKKSVDEIARKLEVPAEQERKRSYCGKDFSLKELEEKVSKYEQRVNSKEHQLWERKILLREIREKIKKLEKEADCDISKSQKMVSKGGKMRSAAMSYNRKKLAALSEMAVYQAQRMQLEEDTKDTKQELENAKIRAEKGEVFDSYAQKMVNMHERDMLYASMMKSHRFDDWDSDDDTPKITRKHYDAYPTQDGLSRPYGAFPVFQPGKPSANLRHYKKESERPIEL